ncbi:Collagen triple helix repeat protein [compost metagenome]
MKIHTKSLLASFTILLSLSGNAQNNVGIGTNTPNPNAILDMQSTTQGVLVPRLTTAQRNAIAVPTEGLLVYDIDVNCFFFYESTAAVWQNLCSGGGGGTPGPQGPAGPTGPAGATGPQGVAGTNGATGSQGPAGPAGATGSQGPAGANGAAGVTGPQGPAGTTGQFANTVYTTGQLVLNTGITTYTLVPGLAQTITVPANAKVYISSDGGFQNANAGVNHGVADFAVFIDGTASTLQRRVPAANSASLGQIISQWSLSSVFNLPAGSHTIQLRAKYAEGTAQLNIGSATADLIKGNLSILIIKE